MLQCKLSDAIVDFAPHLVGRDGTNFRAWHFDGEVHGAAMPNVDDGWSRPPTAGQEVRNDFAGFLGGRESYPCWLVCPTQATRWLEWGTRDFIPPAQLKSRIEWHT